MKIKVYDNGGETFDRYTVVIDDCVFTMSENATAPNGFNQFAGLVNAWLLDGETVDVVSLPEPVKNAILMRISDLLS